MAAPPVHGDPGLQPERTTLAWTRTTVAFAVSSAILLRWIPHYGVLVLTLIFLMVSMALGIYVSQAARHRSAVRGLVAGRARAQVGAVLLMAAGMIVFGVAGIFLILS